jgi:acyl dehydratase
MSMSDFEASLTAEDEISEAAVEAVRPYLGLPLRIELWNTEASADNIRHYALGIGDLNPLWLDRNYARRMEHRCQLAPPTFLYSVFDGGIAPGLPGLSAVASEANWTFADWVRLGDQLTAKASLTGVELQTSKRGRPRVVQTGQTEYFRVDQSGRQSQIATLRQRVVRARNEGGFEYAPRAEHKYTTSELQQIEKAVLGTRRRGDGRRVWESVKVGDQVDPVVKGPYTRMSMVCYYAGAIGSSGYRAFDAWWCNRHLALTNPEALPNNFPPEYFAGTGVTSKGHHDAAVAYKLGMPGAYDNGAQRVALMASAVTNWMGDDGFLLEYRHRLRLPVIMGDTLRIDGTVMAVLDDSPDRVLSDMGRSDRLGAVRLDLRARNQLDEVVSTGDACVLLRKAGK